MFGVRAASRPLINQLFILSVRRLLLILSFRKQKVVVKPVNYTIRLSDEKLKTTTAMLLEKAGCVFMGLIVYLSGMMTVYAFLCNIK